MDIHSVNTQAVLDQISRHCPDALSAYLDCMNRADDNLTAFFSRDLVTVDMSEDWHPFKNKIKKLAREGLLEWHPFNEGISVTLASLHE
jgi:hypothetical protein